MPKTAGFGPRAREERVAPVGAAMLAPAAAWVLPAVGSLALPAKAEIDSRHAERELAR
jgi:hypothetical protein